MAAKKGHKKSGGRKKGSQNKFTKTVKSVFSNVFHDLQNDPEAKLSVWAKENTTEFYKLATKLIPTELTGEDGKSLFHDITLNTNRPTGE